MGRRPLTLGWITNLVYENVNYDLVDKKTLSPEIKSRPTDKELPSFMIVIYNQSSNDRTSLWVMNK